MMSSRWSFKNEDESSKEVGVMIKFIAVNLFNLVWSSIAIWYLVGIITFENPALIQPFTKILVTSIMTLVSFFLYKKFVFTKK
jgi:putative flippase GtrA